MRGWFAAVAAGWLILTTGGCGGSTAGIGPKKLRITATVGMTADLVRNLVGDKAEVTQLLGEGIDPHLYKPTREAVQLLSNADVIVCNGLHLEGRMQETLDQLARSGKTVIAVSEELEKQHSPRLRTISAEQHLYDPHIWMDVALWSDCGDYLARRLGEAAPEHAAEFRTNAAKYRAELAALDAYVKQTIAGIPEQRRHLLTAHDAFEYFSKAYAIPVRSVQGVSTDSEAGLADQNALVSFIVEHSVPAMFIESSVPPKSVQAVIEGAAARGVTVKVGGELFSDAMGATGSYEGTYLGMIDHNATTIALALGGTAPAKGRLGKLAAEPAK